MPSTTHHNPRTCVHMGTRCNNKRMAGGVTMSGSVAWHGQQRGLGTWVAKLRPSQEPLQGRGRRHMIESNQVETIACSCGAKVTRHRIIFYLRDMRGRIWHDGDPGQAPRRRSSTKDLAIAHVQSHSPGPTTLKDEPPTKAR